MSNALTALETLEQNLKDCTRQAGLIVVWGCAAAAMALFGQQSLDHARPIFPMIDQNYGLWQSAYALALLLMCVIWVSAVLQKIGHIQECTLRLKLQRQHDEKLAARRAQALEARRVFEEEKATRPPASFRIRSKKFDY